MAIYYFVGTILPPLSFEDAPEISFVELDSLYRDNLSTSDYDQVRVLRRFYDILNIRSLWMDEELDQRGEMSPIELEEALINRVGLPRYVFDFIDRHPKREDQIHHFPYLLSQFFKSAEKLRDPFLRKFLGFERGLRLVMTAFRAKKLGRDLSVEFQYEDPEEDLIAQLLAQQDAERYEPPEGFKQLKVLFDKFGDDPLTLEKKLDEYRFDQIDNLVDMADPFSIERLLAYYTQFLIVSQWFDMDKEKGMQIVQEMVQQGKKEGKG